MVRPAPSPDAPRRVLLVSEDACLLSGVETAFATLALEIRTVTTVSESLAVIA
jgi:hypothetical protein